MKLQGRTALITGASRGIGKAIAVELAAQGADIGINFQSNEEKALELQKKIQDLGRECHIFRCSIDDEQQVAAMFKEFCTTFKKLDIFVANAGVTQDGPMLYMKAEDFSKILQINLLGTFICLKEAGRQMLRQKYGRVITMSSISAMTGNIGQANYSASKAGIIALTKTFAREFVRRDITANVVAPGAIATDMLESLKPETIEEITKLIPKGRLGMPEEVASLVGFLASQEAGYITGQVFSINGGMLMH